MKTCVIFGGSGFVGTHLALHFLETKRFDHIHLADIRPSSLEGQECILTSVTDVRKPIPVDLIKSKPEWIFNLAAIHREPGHIREEYYDTNLKGAYNVCDYATLVDCNNIYFTSSISVYGPTNGPTTETSPIQPSMPYGGSKYPAELIHTMWKKQSLNRRLIISRPGVIYGPGDPGNIFRMIRAIKNGFFPFPGSPNIFKSYGYIYGLLNSIDFVMDSNLELFCYNYVENPTEPLKDLVQAVKDEFSYKTLVLPLPIWMLMPVAKIVQALLGSKNPIHPVRVKKAATSTHIVPQALVDAGFEFKYNFKKSLKHWRVVSPDDFNLPSSGVDPKKIKLNLKGYPEKITEPIKKNENELVTILSSDAEVEQ